MPENSNTGIFAKETFDTESELISGLKAHNEDALKILYVRYGKAIAGVIFRLTNSKETTEELVQETFVKVWNNIQSYDPGKGRLYTWLINIARNLAIDKTRSSEFKTGKQTQSIENSVYDPESATTTQANSELFDMKELVERLKPQQKDLIDLIYFNGFSQSEVAVKLKIPIGTVKTRVRAAIIELRKFYNVR